MESRSRLAEAGFSERRTMLGDLKLGMLLFFSATKTRFGGATEFGPCVLSCIRHELHYGWLPRLHLYKTEDL